jgi:hypothetical protein
MVIVTATNYSGPEVRFEEIAIDLPKPVLDCATKHWRVLVFTSASPTSTALFLL